MLLSSSTLSDPVAFARVLLDRSLLSRCAAAMGLVAVSLAFRLLIDTAISPGFGYTIFYPAVILSAYWLGSRPGLVAALLSAVIVYGFMGPEALTLRTDSRSLVSLAMFGVSSLLLIYVLGAIRSRLDGLSDNHRRMEALVLSQADLFRDHAARVSDHLQLVSAILQLSARTEGDRGVSRVLTNAASRTLLISRTQRELAGDAQRTIAFRSFAERLVEAAGAEPGRVVVENVATALPLEQAAAIGLVVLDHLSALQGSDAHWSLRIALEEEGEDRVLTLTSAGDAPLPGVRDATQVQAITEQLRGRLLMTRIGHGCAIRIAFPAALQPPPTWQPLAFSLH